MITLLINVDAPPFAIIMRELNKRIEKLKKEQKIEHSLFCDLEMKDVFIYLVQSSRQ